LSLPSPEMSDSLLAISEETCKRAVLRRVAFVGTRRFCL
jgi:hypothetical protein